MIEQQRLNPDVLGQGLNQQVFGGHTRTFHGRGGGVGRRKAMTQRNAMPFSPMMPRNNRSLNKPVLNEYNSNSDKHKRNQQHISIPQKDNSFTNSTTTGVTAADRAARFGTTSKTAIYDNVSTFPKLLFSFSLLLSTC